MTNTTVYIVMFWFDGVGYNMNEMVVCGTYEAAVNYADSAVQRNGAVDYEIYTRTMVID